MRIAFEANNVYEAQSFGWQTPFVEVTLAEYEAARSQPTLFLVVPGHEIDDLTRVLEQNERFAVVEKVGEAGAIAQSHDPRA